MATRRGGGAARSLQDSVDRLAGAFDRLADRLETLEGGAAAGAAATEGDLFIRHVRRYMPFYALALVFALFVLILPTREDDGSQTEASQVTAGQTSSDFTGPVGDIAAPDTDGVAGDDGPGATGSQNGARPAQANVPGTPDGGGAQPAAKFDPLAWTATGKTAGGFDCKQGVRQIPWSAYAIPCFPKWTGNNGGATYRGVSAKEIVIVDREFPESANSRAVEAANTAAGFASSDVADAVGEEWKKYFNKVYELWGRKVKWVLYESQFGDSTAEAQSKGKEGACADANYIVNEIKAFAVISGSNVFAECAAERGLVTFQGGAYFPERWYKKYHPFVWHTTMDCERISEQVGEYIAKRLAKRPAKWAKNELKGRTRKFATYVPNNDEYQYCTEVTERSLQRQGVSLGSRYNYTLDISRFPDEAAKAVIQFKAAQATTLVMACDPISMVFLTQNAKAQNWFPEWFNIGVAGNDADNYPRTWDASAINGSLFGMSQLGRTENLLGPNGEPAKTYKAATGTKIPEGTTGSPTFFSFIFVMNALQATGPNLTPQNMANAIVRLPDAGAPRFDIGKVSFRSKPDGTAGTDHTAIDDSREIWWDHTGTGFDGEKGTYRETMGGKRFTNGQWPREEPPVFRR